MHQKVKFTPMKIHKTVATRAAERRGWERGTGKGGRGLRRGPLRILAGGPRMWSYATGFELVEATDIMQTLIVVVWKCSFVFVRFGEDQVIHWLVPLWSATARWRRHRHGACHYVVPRSWQRAQDVHVPPRPKASHSVTTRSTDQRRSVPFCRVTLSCNDKVAFSGWHCHSSVVVQTRLSGCNDKVAFSGWHCHSSVVVQTRLSAVCTVTQITT